MMAVFLVPLAGIGWTSVEDGPRAFEELLGGRLFRAVLWNTLEISGGSTLASLALGYPIAYHLARSTPRVRAVCMMFVLLPFWTSILVKSFALTVILGEQGIINSLLRGMFGDGATVPLIFNRAGVTIGMTHYLLPFMVFPVLASLLAQGDDLQRAARVMGASPARVFRSVTLPLSLPGVLAGCVMCFVLSLGMFVTPALLGGRKDMMLANLVDFYTRVSLDWGVAAAIAVVLLGLSGVLIAVLSRLPGEHRLV
ncbi:MAG: ABC transporter permease [Planctomycetes bacterium]|nr:ABC transporter permease [Planctomycetota bacterium]